MEPPPTAKNHVSLELRALIEQFLHGQGSPESLAEAILASEPASVAEGLRIDRDRRRRCGYAEVIYGEGKSCQAIRVAIDTLLQTEPEALVTRLDPTFVPELQAQYAYLRWSAESRCLRVNQLCPPLPPQASSQQMVHSASQELVAEVAVVSAGTTDRKIALEAAETLAWMGVACRVVEDVGVAGPYRLIPHLPALRRCQAIVVVAGMEAALASIVAGHVAVPIIAVPTSVGYGANFGGLAALLSMLNSCAANVSVVNIDAGFKGGYIAGMIAKGARTVAD